jgi:flagellar biosynthetic protein FliR
VEALLHQLQGVYTVLLWPFFRFGAALAVAPVFGEAVLPVRARLLLALVLAVAVQPALPPAPEVDPVSLHGVLLVFEQVLVGAMIGLAFHLVLSALTVFGTLASTQLGLSMAMLNDPVGGTSSDAVSALVYVVFVLLFFALDGHLLVTHVAARSFHVWPVGAVSLHGLALQGLALGVGWIFAAALMLALPLVFAAMAVQFGAGLLNRVAPTLNLFVLGFSVTIVFGLLLLLLLVPSLPGHVQRMLLHVVGLLDGLAVVPVKP